MSIIFLGEVFIKMKQAMTPSQLIARVGETDQLFLTAPTPALAIERAQLRLALVKISSSKQEQIHFLTEATVILELANTEVTEQEIHIQVSAQLAEVYLQWHQVTHEQRYLIVAGQILRPLSNSGNAAILLRLARLDAVQKKEALTKHWLTRWLQVLPEASHALLDFPEFTEYLAEAWFQEINRQAQALIPQLLANPITDVHS
jgi:hypothetical protein